MELVESEHAASGCEEEEWRLSSSDLLHNCSYQFDSQGDAMFGLFELVCVTAVCILLMLLGILGNMLTILVVWLRPHMRSSTYLYLSSMAVSDLLILLLLPVDLYKLWRPRPWPLGDLACKLTMFLSECCTFSTILHITSLSLERYMAVCWPIVSKTLVTRHRTKTLIGCLWLGAALSATPVLLMVGVEDVGQAEGEGGWAESEVQWLVERKGGDEGWRGSEGGGEDGHLTQGLGSGGSGEPTEWLAVGGGVERLGGGQEMEGEDEGGRRGERGEAGESGPSGMGRGGGRAGGELGEGERQQSEDAIGRDERDERDERDGGEATQGDNRECRCTDYAVTSGLMSAMTILANLYFLVSLGILAAVYSLIGRTLLLRPPSSRGDQSHRHTVKMLGVIVLVFVLCWLPFHIGRTILSFSLGSTVGVEDVSMATDGETHSSAHTDGHFSTIPDTEMHIRDGPAHTTPGPAFASPPATTEGSDDDRQTTHYYDMNSTIDPFVLYYVTQYFNLVSFVLFYLSAAVNPLLYNLMSARYRQAVRSLAHSLAPSLVHSRNGSGSENAHDVHVPARHSTTTM